MHMGACDCVCVCVIYCVCIVGMSDILKLQLPVGKALMYVSMLRFVCTRENCNFLPLTINIYSA